jgi:hypothetical protein
VQAEKSGGVVLFSTKSVSPRPQVAGLSEVKKWCEISHPTMRKRRFASRFFDRFLGVARNDSGQARQKDGG